MNKICQSCAMPLTSPELYATNKDGSPNKDYCKWCYDGGKFVDDVSMEQYIEMCSQFGEQAGMTNEQMKEYCQKIFPTLKRWKKQQGNIVASSKEYRDFVLEQLRGSQDITCKPMMGEFLLYHQGVLFGGIYDDRFLVKITDTNKKYALSKEIPYTNAKPMFLVDNLEDTEYLSLLVKDTCKGLKK